MYDPNKLLYETLCGRNWNQQIFKIFTLKTEELTFYCFNYVTHPPLSPPSLPRPPSFFSPLLSSTPHPRPPSFLPSDAQDPPRPDCPALMQRLDEHRCTLLAPPSTSVSFMCYLLII